MIQSLYPHAFHHVYVATKCNKTALSSYMFPRGLWAVAHCCESVEEAITEDYLSHWVHNCD